MMDRRFSTLFDTAQPLQPQPQLTAPLGSITTQQKPSHPHAENPRTASPSPSTSPSPYQRNSRIKMDRRFSTFLSFPSFQSTNTPPRTPSPSIHSDTLSLTSRKSVRSVKGLLRRIFPSSNTITCTSNLQFSSSSTEDAEKENIPTSEQLGEQLWRNLIGQSRPSSPTPPSSRPSSPSPISTSTPKRTTQRSTTVIVPAPSSTLAHKPRSRFSQALKGSNPKHGQGNNSSGGMEVIGILQPSKKRGFGAGRIDSKFSSITSLPSVHSLSLPSLHAYSPVSCGNILISVASLAILQRSVRRTRRGLLHQEFLTTHLSNNLIHLFARKEAQIAALKRLRSEDKQTLTAALFRIKESTGRTFLRKAVFLQRSQELVAQLHTLLSQAQATITSSSAVSAGEGSVEVEDTVFDLLALIREDCKTQRELDERLKSLLVKESAERRWGGSPGERSLVRKFVGFVEGRCARLGDAYGRIEGLVREGEAVVKL